jgi:isochorismate synthase
MSGQWPLGAVQVSGDDGPSGSGPLVFVSAPFDRNAALRFWAPEHVVVLDALGNGWVSSASDVDVALQAIASEPVPSTSGYSFVTLEESPSPNGYAHMVAAAVEELRHTDLRKVVLARRLIGEADREIDPAVVAARLRRRERTATLYATPGLEDDRLVGASPELLISVLDGSVVAHPLAGTVALDDGDDDVDYEKWLKGSPKNLFEHLVVVEDIVERLSAVCDDVRAEAEPSIVTLRSIAHLGTWIHGKITEPQRATPLELLSLLHPTPAVGGLSQEGAIAAINRLEPADRGLYAGAAGWCDFNGSGEFWITIRGLTVSGQLFSAWAGAGIVADSDPVAEREETTNKMAAITAGLGERD